MEIIMLDNLNKEIDMEKDNGIPNKVTIIMDNIKITKKMDLESINGLMVLNIMVIF